MIGVSCQSVTVVPITFFPRLRHRRLVLGVGKSICQQSRNQPIDQIKNARFLILLLLLVVVIDDPLPRANLPVVESTKRRAWADLLCPSAPTAAAAVPESA